MSEAHTTVKPALDALWRRLHADPLRNVSDLILDPSFSEDTKTLSVELLQAMQNLFDLSFTFQAALVEPDVMARDRLLGQIDKALVKVTADLERIDNLAKRLFERNNNRLSGFEV